jgi:tRNA 2-thiocytidine biosynthesis protein TtcA
MSNPDRIAFFLLKPVARACKEFELLAEGERVAVAVSGGKDSRALLDLLMRCQARVPFSYDLIALHVVGTSAGFPDRSAERASGEPQPNPSRRSLRPELEPWFQEIGVEYILRRWSCRRRSRCPSIATTLLSLMYGGRLETMLPRREFFDERVTVIRPLIHVPEKELARYAKAAAFPDLPPLCPQGLTSQRAQVKALLRHFGRDQKQIRANLWHAARQAIEF